jgi:hypothetical protein
MCPHLTDIIDTDDDLDYVRLLTGHGIDADLCCTACDRAGQQGAAIDLRVVCEGCVARFDDGETGYFSGWRGEPGIAERPEPVDPAIVTTPLPTGFGTVLDLAAMPNADGASRWLALTASAQLVRFDADTGVYERVGVSGLRSEPDHQPWAGHALRERLHVAADGRFAAVVHDFGRHGKVVDLASGHQTLTLHGGAYHSETVPFSVAFAERGGRTVVVHRTAWNRLVVSDPETGRDLTPRHPARDPDYFHGALRVSPDSRWLLDDGWVWSPVGIPRVWDLERWESRALCQRDYHWNVPMCWIGDDLVAVSGIGTDDIAMLPGVRVFDATTGVELLTFAGPRGELFSAGRRLYSAAPDGLEIWDALTGHRTGRVPGFVPTHHHPTAGELVKLHEGTLLRCRVDQGSSERLLAGKHTKLP